MTIVYDVVEVLKVNPSPDIAVAHRLYPIRLSAEYRYTKLGGGRTEDTTLEELRDEWQRQEINGYSILEKEDIIRRNEGIRSTPTCCDPICVRN